MKSVDAVDPRISPPRVCQFVIRVCGTLCSIKRELSRLPRLWQPANTAGNYNVLCEVALHHGMT